ncbi:MAG: two-component regulator propeller domain-containing protein, partial [Saprospiraceae bacterium]|nr:two-component regulator propeller domain-containing protein [Saprospiraceae bacterium]
MSIWLLVWVTAPGFLAVGRVADAQQPVRFSHLTVDDGLSNSEVRSAIQDENGFLWIGTADGLNRYNGYEFAVFQYDPTDPASISNNQINTLLQAADGTLWVGTADGLNRYDPELVRFTVYDAEDDISEQGEMMAQGLAYDTISSLFEDALGRIWIGHASTGSQSVGGLSRLDPRTGQVDYLDGIGDAPVHVIIADSTGIMWIGTGDGLHAVDPVTDDVTTYRHDPDNPNSLAGNDIRHLAFDLQGRLWVGMWGTGLDNLDTVSGIAEHHRSIAAGGQLASGFVSALTHT